VSYGFIRDNVAAFPVSVMCEVLEVSRSGYYGWASRPESTRATADRALAAKIRASHAGSRGRYGTARGCMPSCARMAIGSAASAWPV
jgi:putative transposase